MKAPSIVNSLAMSGCLLATGIAGCEEKKRDGMEIHITDSHPRAEKINSALKDVRKKFDECPDSMCQDAVISLRNSLLKSAGLEPNTETWRIPNDQSQCNVLSEVDEDKCTPRNHCEIVRVGEK